MNFWQNSGLQYRDLIDISEDKLIVLSNGMSRQDIIDWLAWNDRNGIYRDEDSIKELGNIMSREEGIEIMIRQITQSEYR